MWLQAQEDALHIVVRNQEGQEVVFKLEHTTMFSILFAAYCGRQALDRDEVKFLLDGQRFTMIMEFQTPMDLGIENFDVIDCVMRQQGD